MTSISNPTQTPEPCSTGWEHLESSQAVRAWLGEIRSRWPAASDEIELDKFLEGLSKAVERMLGEHAGMSAELLNVYEQLGVIFEVTRRLQSVRHKYEVIDLFVDCLRHSFADAWVWVERPDYQSRERQRPGPGASASGSEGGHAPRSGVADVWLAKRIDQARRSGKVIVERREVGLDPMPVVGTEKADLIKAASASDRAPALALGAPIAAVNEVMVGPVFVGRDYCCAIVLSRTVATGVTDAPVAFRSGDMLLVEALTQFCGDLLRNYRLMRELREMSLAMVRALVNAVDQKDEYTSGHSIRVGFFATLLGRTLKLSEGDLQMLQWSALLHDVGKIGIRDDVLKKTSKLTEEEFRHIQEHPVRSHKVVQQIPQLARALDGILYHHEHYDGKGYPTGLKGDDIPLQARIIQIADVFDALTSTRSYRPAHDWRRALAIMEEESGKTLDPSLRESFDALIRGELEGYSDGWERLLVKANRFAAETDPVSDHPSLGSGNDFKESRETQSHGSLM